MLEKLYKNLVPLISDIDENNKTSDSKTISHCRVVLNRDLTKRLNVYLNFTVTWRTNLLGHKRDLTSRQEDIYDLIKSMHDSGLGYRRITKRLSDMNIKTVRGSVFKNNNVFASYKEIRRATGTS